MVIFAYCKLCDLPPNKVRKDMVKIGDVCPLFFNPVKDKFAQDIEYIQKFHISDKILIQVFYNSGDTVNATLTNIVTNNTSPLSLSTYTHNGNVMMKYISLTGLGDGIYAVTVNGNTCEPFCVSSSDELLDETTLIEYSHKSNNSAFDNIFWIGETQQIFQFRIEAGFKPGGYSSKVNNEQYRNQMQEAIDLYAIPYDTYALTIGNAVGVPYWIAKFINRILCISSVKIDGKNYIRSESSVPEMSQVSEDSQVFYVSVLLELQNNDIAGIGGAPEQGSTSSTVGFSIENPTDGQMLQYNGDKSAFTNVTTVEV